MSDKVELLYHPASFYSQKARMFLAEKETSPALRVINFHGGENLTNEYLRMNPEGNVPVAMFGDRAVPDSSDIMRRGEEELSGPVLVPEDIREEVWRLHDDIHALRVEIITYGCAIHAPYSAEVQLPYAAKRMMRNRAFDDEGRTRTLARSLETVAPDLRHCVEKKMAVWDARAKAMRSRDELEASLAELEKVLDKCEAQIESSGGPFLFGSRFTMADIDLAVLLQRLRVLGQEERFFPEDGQRQNLRRFWAAVGERKSFQLIVTEFRIPLLMKISPGGVASALLVVAAVAIGIFLYRRRSLH